MNKRGQFFLLAAVIISAIVLSMGITANYARTNKEPINFYDFSFDVKKESGAVIDYEVYSNFDDGANLAEFVGLLAGDIQDRDSDSNFMFIYGDSSSLTVENYGEDVAQILSGGDDAKTVPGKMESTISFNGNSIAVKYKPLGTAGAKAQFDDLGEDASIKVKVIDSEFDFPISDYKQVIFLIQKEEGNEAYISVE